MPPEGTDDEGEDELGLPLPPDDRLWRHPSELGAARRAGPAPTGAAAAQARGPRRSSSWLVGAVAGLTGAVVTLGAVLAFGGLDRGGVEQTTVLERVAVPPTATLPVSIGAPEGGAEALAAIVARIGPAVARVSVTRTTADEDGSPGTTTTTGSAVVFRDDGYLLTSADLVAHSVAVAVVVGDGALRPGRVVGVDPVTDVAVLKVDGDGLPTAVLGSVEDLDVGQPAVIIGSPASPGDDAPVTSGIVSALGRTVRPVDTQGTARHDLIQTDAPLDLAATGGALVDRRGAVVGITTDPPDVAAGDGLSFATPVDTALEIAEDIIGTGSAHHAWLGIEGADVEAQTADDLELTGGARVAAVTEGSPADEAGLAPGDVITSVDAVGVTSMADLVVELRDHEPGDTVFVAYVRDGRPGFCIARLAERASA